MERWCSLYFYYLYFLDYSLANIHLSPLQYGVVYKCRANILPQQSNFVTFHALLTPAFTSHRTHFALSFPSFATFCSSADLKPQKT